MMIAGFICEKCDKVYYISGDALQCEQSHTKIEDMKIKRCNQFFQKTYGFNYLYRVPKEIVISFSDNHGDFAIYEFKHYGPRGV